MIVRSDGAAADIDPLAFLGDEFLTWLWFQTETDGGEFDLDEHGKVAIMLDDMIMFAPRDDDQTEQTLKKGTPSRTPEAAIALRNGRQLRRAKLLLAQGEDQWSVIIDGQTLNLLSIKLPEDDEDATTFEDKSRGRMHNFLLLHDLVSGLYRLFLRERLQPAYLKTTAEAQANWMVSRS